MVDAPAEGSPVDGTTPPTPGKTLWSRLASWRGTILRAGLGILGLIASGALLSALFRHELTSIGRFFVDRYAGPGLALAITVAESSPLPIPQMPMLFLGLAGGLRLWEIFVFALLGTLTGNTLAFLGGRLLHRLHLADRVLGERVAPLERLIERWGFWAIAIAAIAPIPFGVLAWSAGGLGMRWRTFGFGLVWRIGKVSLNVAFITLGWWIGTGKV